MMVIQIDDYVDGGNYSGDDNEDTASDDRCDGNHYNVDVVMIVMIVLLIMIASVLVMMIMIYYVDDGNDSSGGNEDITGDDRYDGGNHEIIDCFDDSDGSNGDTVGVDDSCGNDDGNDGADANDGCVSDKV